MPRRTPSPRRGAALEAHPTLTRVREAGGDVGVAVLEGYISELDEQHIELWPSLSGEVRLRIPRESVLEHREVDEDGRVALYLAADTELERTVQSRSNVAAELLAGSLLERLQAAAAVDALPCSAAGSNVGSCEFPSKTGWCLAGGTAVLAAVAVSKTKDCQGSSKICSVVCGEAGAAALAAVALVEGLRSNFCEVPISQFCAASNPESKTKDCNANSLLCGDGDALSPAEVRAFLAAVSFEVCPTTGSVCDPDRDEGLTPAEVRAHIARAEREG